VRYGSSKLLKIIEIDTDQKRICDFLLVFHCNYVPIFYGFRDIAIYW